MSRSGQFKVYKNTGAAQFSLIGCRRDERGFVTREGAVLVEVTKCNGKDKDGNILADWGNKISFAINMADICNLMDEYNERAGRLFHNYKGNIKTLEFRPGTGEYEGTYMLQVNEGGKGGNSVSVPLTNGEYNMIMTLLVRAAAPQLIGWE